jgi:hypoxanthine phosphoribosyltransferase
VGVDDAIGEVLVSEEDLQRRVAELGAEVSRDYDGRAPLLVAILKGAVPFLADLMRHLTIDCELDFMAVSSYGSSTDSSGVVRILKDLDAPIADRDVLIIEDIIDSGLTLDWLLKYLEGLHPASVAVVSMLRKPGVQRVDIPVKYLGFDIPNEFVVGYGLDYAERYRELPFIGVLNPAVYQK